MITVDKHRPGDLLQFCKAPHREALLHADERDPRSTHQMPQIKKKDNGLTTPSAVLLKDSATWAPGDRNPLASQPDKNPEASLPQALIGSISSSFTPRMFTDAFVLGRLSSQCRDTVRTRQAETPALMEQVF